MEVARERREARLTRVFDCTDMFGEFAGRAFFASELPQGRSCTLVGPDPFTKRDFYGTVMRKGGEIVIK